MAIEDGAKGSRGTQVLQRETEDAVHHALDPISAAPPVAEPEADFAPLPEAGRPPDVREVDPYQRDSVRAQEAFDAAVAAEAGGDEELAIQEYIRASKIAETAREWHLAAVACQRVGDFLLEPPGPCDPERAFRMYRRAVAAYEQCGLFAEGRELAYRQMRVKMVRAGDLGVPFTQRLELYLHWAVAGFGYRPMRVVASSLLVVIVYGLIYWALRGAVTPGGARSADLWHSIYFSGATFATIGYGDFVPAPSVQFLALTEGFTGVFMMGLFVAVLANRLQRA